MLRFSSLISILLAAAGTAVSAHPPAPGKAAASSPRASAVEEALREVLAGVYSFRFYQYDTLPVAPRLQAAGQRLRGLAPAVLTTMGAERVALIEAEMSVDPRFVNLPGCVPAPELERRLVGIEGALDRLAALLGDAPPAGPL